jgi:hypothetical protein
MMIMMEVLPVCLQYPPIERKILFSAQTRLNKTQLSLEIRKDAPESQEEYFLLIAGQLRELFRTSGNT